MKFYVIYFENGATKCGYFPCYLAAVDYAEEVCHEFDYGCAGFTIESYADEAAYLGL